MSDDDPVEDDHLDPAVLFDAGMETMDVLNREPTHLMADHASANALDPSHRGPVAWARRLVARIRSTAGRLVQRSGPGDTDGEIVAGLANPVVYNRSTGLWSTRTGQGQLLQNIDRNRLIQSALTAEKSGPFRPPPLDIDTDEDRGT